MTLVTSSICTVKLQLGSVKIILLHVFVSAVACCWVLMM